MILRNRYVRCFIASGIASLTAAKVSKLLDWTIPELTPTDGLLNDVEYASILGVIAGIGAVLLGAAFGAPDGSPVVPPAAAAAAGGAA